MHDDIAGTDYQSSVVVDLNGVERELCGINSSITMNQYEMQECLRTMSDCARQSLDTQTQILGEMCSIGYDMTRIANALESIAPQPPVEAVKTPKQQEKFTWRV